MSEPVTEPRPPRADQPEPERREPRPEPEGAADLRARSGVERALVPREVSATESAVDGEGAADGDAEGGEEVAAPREAELLPTEIVRRLDEYIIGQAEAKRAVAVALRNRVRRQRLPEEMRQEVLPKNILMIGPTGVGKTEIARRLARMTSSPFIKVEATKFTEVGYVGRDVEAILRDLLEQTITDVHNDRIAEVEERAAGVAEQRLLDSLVEAEEAASTGRRGHGHGHGGAGGATAARQAVDARGGEAASAGTAPPGDGASAASGDDRGPSPDGAAAEVTATTAAPAAPTATPAATAAAPAPPTDAATERRRRRLRRRLARQLAAKQLEDRLVDVEVEEPFQPMVESFSGTGYEDMGATLSDFFSQLAPPRRRVKRMSVADARTVLAQEETDRLIDMDRVYDDAIRMVEEAGIVFIDEVDKIAGQGSEHGPDVSGEGVQRDLLPILEGSTVHTRYGSLRTDHVLFVAAGAFNVSRPSDLIPEFQGRFPIRVELRALTEADLQRILVEPSNALTKQYCALLGTEGVTLDFREDGLREIAHQAASINDQDENIGARRLFTILEKVLEDLSFVAEQHAGETVPIDAEYVRTRLGDLVRNEDLRRFVL